MKDESGRRTEDEGPRKEREARAKCAVAAPPYPFWSARSPGGVLRIQTANSLAGRLYVASRARFPVSPFPAPPSSVLRPPSALSAFWGF